MQLFYHLERYLVSVEVWGESVLGILWPCARFVEFVVI